MVHWLNLSDEEIAAIGAAGTEPGTPLHNLHTRIAEWVAEQSTPRAQAYRAATPTRDGETECDGGAVVSFSDDPGAYVMTWTWVDAEDAGDAAPEGEEEAA